jgi:hypothetical protein
MAKKRKKSLTPEEIDKVREGIAEIRRDLREVLAIIQSKLGQKPA